MGFRRTIARLDFVEPVTIVRAPDGARFEGRMSRPRRTRHDGDVVVVRFDDDEVSVRFAIALSPRALSWEAALGADGARRVMLYRVSEERAAGSEVRRVLSPQRRDALFKADLELPERPAQAD